MFSRVCCHEVVVSNSKNVAVYTFRDLYDMSVGAGTAPIIS